MSTKKLRVTCILVNGCVPNKRGKTRVYRCRESQVCAYICRSCASIARCTGPHHLCTLSHDWSSTPRPNCAPYRTPHAWSVRARHPHRCKDSRSEHLLSSAHSNQMNRGSSHRCSHGCVPRLCNGDFMVGLKTVLSLLLMPA